MAWLDIIIIVLVVIMAFIGMYRGFLKSLLHFFGTIVTLVFAIWLSRPFSLLLESWFGLNSALGKVMYDPIAAACAEGDGGAIPNFFLNKFAEILMGGNYWSGYTNGSNDTAFIVDFSNEIGSIIGIVISIVILYILFRIGVAILGKIVDKITQNKTLGGLNRFLGLLFGALKGGLAVSVVFVVAYLLSPVIPVLGDWVSSLLAENTVSNTIFGWLADFTDNTLLPWFSNVT